jgi:hypothetical protein
MKIRPVAAELFHVNGQTGGETEDDITKINSRLSEFCTHT